MRELISGNQSHFPVIKRNHRVTCWFVSGLTLLLAGTVKAVVGQGAQEPALFTARQAAQGKKIYAMRCAGCHGDRLQGGAASALEGQAFAVAWENAGSWGNSKLTVEDLDFIIRTTMPKDAPGKLSAEDYTEVLAFILQQNGYKSGPTPLRAGSPLMKKTRLHFGTASEQAMAPPPLRLAGDPAAVPKGGGPTQEELNNAADSTSNWLYQTHDYSGSRYVALD
jgi:mono/diheme cytochrome c family protein